VSAAALTRLRVLRARQPLTIALSVMADLTARGVPADSAAAAVLALAGSLRDDQFLAFRRSVERDIELGAPARRRRVLFRAARRRIAADVERRHVDLHTTTPPVTLRHR